jgi:hypothetical protein
MLCLLALLMAALPCCASSTRPLAPLPVPSGARVSVPPSDPDHFTFVVSGDNRSAGRGIAAPPTAAEIFAETRLLHPAFVLWTGDSIYGSDDTLAEAAAEYDAFLAQAASAEVPVYNAPGNHEIYNRPELADLYQSRMGRLYGSFDYGNSHFIALDTEEIKGEGSIGKEQQAWLEQDLKANRGAAHIFVFMHHPPFPKEHLDGFSNPANRDAIHKLFVQYGVKQVFCGHEHLFYKTEQDGVTYWVSGGAGAPQDAAPQDGGFQHFLLVQVDGDNVTATILQPWRLFVTVGPVAPDGSCIAQASNYNDADLLVAIAFPVSLKPADISLSASWTYKGTTHPLTAAFVPSTNPAVLLARVVVPKHFAAVVTLRPKR